MALVTPDDLKAASSLGAWRRWLQEQYILFLVRADKREAKEKEEATVRQGLSTQGEISGMGFAEGNLLPWQRGDCSHYQVQAYQKCLPSAIVFSEDQPWPRVSTSWRMFTALPQETGVFHSRCRRNHSSPRPPLLQPWYQVIQSLLHEKFELKGSLVLSG